MTKAVRPGAGLPPAPGPGRAGRARAAAAVYRRLAAATLRGRVRHPAGFVLRTLGTGLVVITEIVGVVLVVEGFGSLAGWTAPEVVLLVGLGAAGQGLGLVFGDRLEPAFFSEVVRKGSFDQVLTRPTSPLGWMVASYVEVRFLGRVAVGAGIDFRVAAGEFVGYAGPNGAGKSTTVKMMSGPDVKYPP